METFGIAEGFDGDGGPADQASLNLPSSVAFDPDGNLYISDQRNQRIRQIDLLGVITSYAGTTAGFADGLKEEAQFDFPTGVEPIPGGKLSINTHDWSLYIADTENHRIRRLNFFTGQITTVAGTGEPGYSGDEGNARSARLNLPTDVVFREDHHIYIADSGNHVIRKIDPFGTITTLAGTGEPGFSPDGTEATAAMLNTPRGIFYDEVNHLLYIADTYNHQIKRVQDK
jgi:sugar lactone lactonase YvrE